MDDERTPITAVPFPSDDLVFAARVRDALREVVSQPVEEAIDGIRSRLRPVHRDVVAHLRSDLAGFGSAPVVYVFRDGSARHKLNDDWIDAPTAARLVTDGEGVYVDANEAAARLFGVDRDEIVGRPAGSFTRPDSRIEDAHALWEALAHTGRLHSLAVIQCRDGTETTVEFVTIRDGDGPGRNVTVLRETGDGRLAGDDLL